MEQHNDKAYTDTNTYSIYLGSSREQHKFIVAQSQVVLRLGRILMKSGASAYRIKASMARLAKAVGLDEHHAQVTFTEIATTAYGNGNFRTEVAEQQTSTEVQAGDVLETITPEGGQATTITSFSQLRDLMTTIAEGTRVTLGVRRGDQQVAAALTTIAPQEGTTGSLLGLSLKISVDSQVDATFGLSDVGGPSAGMMFALGVVDEITPGALTGGKDISGTGTIDINGQVGPIGGIQQKMAGARKAGSTYFLAPASNCDEVKGHEPKGMQVFAVGTLHEAVTATEAIASGDTSGLASCSAK